MQQLRDNGYLLEFYTVELYQVLDHGYIQKGNIHKAQWSLVLKNK